MGEDRSIHLKVVGDRTMHCAGCASTVKFTLSQIPGVLRVEADHKLQTIEIETSPASVSLETIKAELEWIGYQVEAP